jgi:hypothetical protein
MKRKAMTMTMITMAVALAIGAISSQSIAWKIPVTQSAWPAPVGHRQPRAEDLAANMQPSPSDHKQQQLDEFFGRKLMICRDC